MRSERKELTCCVASMAKYWFQCLMLLLLLAPEYITGVEDVKGDIDFSSARSAINLNINISMDIDGRSWSLHDSSDSISPERALDALLSLFSDERKQTIRSNIRSGITEIQNRDLKANIDDDDDDKPPSSLSKVSLSNSFPQHNDTSQTVIYSNITAEGPFKEQFTSSFQSCTSDFVSATIRILVDSEPEGLSWSLIHNDTDSIVAQSPNNYNYDGDESWYDTHTCIVPDNCYNFIITGQNNNSYSQYVIYLDQKVYKSGKGLPDTNVPIGKSCQSNLNQNDDDDIIQSYQPKTCNQSSLILSPIHPYSPSSTFDTRTDQILTIITAVSGRQPLLHAHSPQYQAACWILYDDDRQLNATDPSLLQRYILAVLFHSTDGLNWTNPYYFLSSKHECQWKDDNQNEWGYLGVTCRDGQVSNINLGYNNLNGYFPSDVSKLNYLESLILPNNLLKGTIPPELGDLSNLSNFILTKNLLTGTVPEKLYELTSLQTMNLQQNSFRGTISTNIGNLKELTVLSLSQNEFQGTIPESMYDNLKLQRLSLDNNDLMGTISTKIGRLTKLKSMDLSRNDLKGPIPSQIGNTNLQTLNFDGNTLTGIVPSEIGRLIRLRRLILSNNQLYGTIPDTLYKLQTLMTLDMSQNHLTGTMPSAFANKIQTIRLNDNRLRGSIPSSLGTLPKLFKLRLEANNFTGTVSNDLCNHFQTDPGARYGYKTIFTTDCAYQYLPPKVNCTCCTSCFGRFSPYSHIGRCPGSEIQIDIDYRNSDWYRTSWFLTDVSNQTIFQEGPLLSIPKTTSYKACVSTTDCFSFMMYNPTGISYLDRKLFVNGELLDESENATIEFGFDASTKSLKLGTCDPVEIFGTRLEVGSRQREVYNQLVKASNFDILNNPDSPQYKAAYWIFKEVEDDVNISHGSLVQRYILVLFYYTTKGEQWLNNTGFLTKRHECDWYGITCDEVYTNVIRSIHLAENQLEGNLIHELGELSALQTLDLSNNNNLNGEIPTQFAKLWSLEELNLGGNGLNGTIPEQLKRMKRLKKLDLKKNSLSGGIPPLENLKQLEVMDLSENVLCGSIAEEGLPTKSLARLDLSSNLFTGSIPSGLTHASNLYELTLSNNGFVSDIPSTIFNLSQLTRLSLNENMLTGTIPSEIANITQLTHLMLFNNDLTGTIPTEVGVLRNLVNLSLSYNSLKGNIPSETKYLENLSLLHLHGNELTGSTNHWMKKCTIWDKDRSFIADCGTPSVTDSQLNCECCTECCNADGMCQLNDLKRFSPIQTAFLSTGTICASLFFLSTLTMCAMSRNFLRPKHVDFDALQSSGEESVYCLMLTNSVLSWVINLLTVFLQILLFGLFLRAATFSYEDNDWIYSIRCPETGVDCRDEKNISFSAWFIFNIFMLTSLLPDMTAGLKLVYQSAYSSSFRCLASGLTLVFVTILAALTSFFYNRAIAQSDTEVIINAAVLLFVNDVDERVLLVLEDMFPKWVKRRLREAEEYSNKLGGGKDTDTTDGASSIGELSDSDVMKEMRDRIESLEKICSVLVQVGEKEEEEFHRRINVFDERSDSEFETTRERWG